MPSGSARTVPIMCEPDSAGMQSTVFDGAGQGPLWLPSRIVGEPPLAASWPVPGLSVYRTSRETVGDSLTSVSTVYAR